MYACLDAPDFPDKPEIEFISISKTMLLQGSFGEDTTEVAIMFTDGDGDLGSNDELNVFFIDQRDSFEAYQYRIPFIPEEGAANGISGEIYIDLLTSCCIYESGLPPCEPSDDKPTDTVVYEVYIKDRAGHESNKLELPPITLICD